MLGIDWLKIVIHLVVIVVLGVGLYLLLYKPILRFIRNRQETIQKGLDDGKAMQEEGQAAKKEYDDKLATLEEERKDVLAKAEEESREIIRQANLQADRDAAEIKERAAKEAAQAKKQAVDEIQTDASKVAITLAGEILRREISQEENDRLIEECLKAWKDYD